MQAIRLPLQLASHAFTCAGIQFTKESCILSESGLEFDIAPPRLAEKFDAALTLRELTLWNAVGKGMSVAQTRPDAVVLAADTLVALDDKIIGKLADLDEATEVLQRLSGRTHEVCSGVQFTIKFRGDWWFSTIFPVFAFIA